MMRMPSWSASSAAASALAAVRDIAHLALAAENVGERSAAWALSVDYAKTRQAVRRPIVPSRPQALVCRHADARRSARAATAEAAATASEQPPRLPLLRVGGIRRERTRLLLCRAGDNPCARGIGFTWEHPLTCISAGRNQTNSCSGTGRRLRKRPDVLGCSRLNPAGLVRLLHRRL